MAGGSEGEEGGAEEWNFDDVEYEGGGDDAEVRDSTTQTAVVPSTCLGSTQLMEQPRGHDRHKMVLPSLQNRVSTGSFAGSCIAQ